MYSVLLGLGLSIVAFDRFLMVLIVYNRFFQLLFLFIKNPVLVEF